MKCCLYSGSIDKRDGFKADEDCNAKGVERHVIMHNLSILQ